MMLKGKAITVIGGTSGIGLSAVRTFLSHGAFVVACGKDDDHLIAAKNYLSGNVHIQSIDIHDSEFATKIVDTCIKLYGRLDGLYHVAGGSGRSFGDGPLHELTLDAWNKTMHLNVSSVMLSNQAAIRCFQKHETSGTILNVSSVLAYHPSPTHFSTHAYAAAKAAVIGFSKSIAAYYASQNIRINVLAPGLIETPMSARAQSNDEIIQYVSKKQSLDGGRIGKAEDLDGLATFFMSDQSKFVTGQVVAIDGGWNVS